MCLPWFAHGTQLKRYSVSHFINLMAQRTKGFLLPSSFYFCHESQQKESNLTEEGKTGMESKNDRPSHVPLPIPPLLHSSPRASTTDGSVSDCFLLSFPSSTSAQKDTK
jgi:hypothetical protein